MFKQHQIHCGGGGGEDHYGGRETGSGPEGDPRTPKRRPRPTGLRNGNESVEKKSKKSKKKNKKKNNDYDDEEEEEEGEEEKIKVGVGEHTISSRAQESSTTSESAVEGKER